MMTGILNFQVLHSSGFLDELGHEVGNIGSR
jgi:hypothetical protein